MTNPHQTFKQECHKEIFLQGASAELHQMSINWIKHPDNNKYSYHFDWLGRPIIQCPQDIVAFQEIVWATRPDLIIETGIAHGGSLILSASMLAMLDYCDVIAANGDFSVLKTPKRKVLGIDIDIRAHNRAAIEAHPLHGRISMLQGSSIDKEIIAQVYDFAHKGGFQKIMVCLDSNHTHDHVLAELEAYAPLVTKGNYCIVWDTIIEDMPENHFLDRPWGKGNNPKTAVHKYLQQLKSQSRIGNDGTPLAFSIDSMIENKLLITVAPDGFLKRV